ncbi:MAG: biotin--[Clostridia bacterium]|nr:biotin--[acetyl-CoA-carboxylase] ligase [Clostridia bacterium]
MSADNISNMLKTADVRTVCLESIDSTSTYARSLVDSGETSLLLVVADEQTGGRGRNGKSFYSSNKGSVYMSVVLHPCVPFADAVGVTTASAVAVSRAIEKVTGKSTEIKWVNDLYSGGKKVCGILCEAVGKNGNVSAVIIGVGINLADCEFPDELAGIADTLGCDASLRDSLIAAVADELFSLSFGALSEVLLDEYRRKSLVIGKCIDFYVNGQKNTATAVGIDECGGLIIRKDDGTQDVLRS